MIYVTSDYHYSHKNICGPTISSWSTGYRDYNSIEEMNDAIVQSTNNIVLTDDTLIFVGDWSFGGKEQVELLRNRINCKNIIFIYGNHDKHVMKNYQHIFTECHNEYTLNIDGISILFSHYISKNLGNHDLNVHGHYHHTRVNTPTTIDVGWCKYRRPLHISEIVNYARETRKTQGQA